MIEDSIFNNSNFLLISFVASIFLFTWIKEKKNISAKKFKPIDKNHFFFRDPKKHTHYISRSLRKLLRVKSRNISIKKLSSFFCEADQKKLLELSNHSAEDSASYTNKPISLELKKEITGKRIYLNCNKMLINNSKGRPMRAFFLFFSDVTEQALTNHLIQKENEVLRQELTHKNNILNTLPIPIWARDKDLNISYFNNKYNEIISETREEDGHQQNKELTKNQKSLSIQIRKYQKPKSEEKYVVVGGKRRLFKLTETPVIGSKIIVGTGHDITNKDNLRSDLKKHISAQSDLLESSSSAVSIYDINTKLRFFNQAFMKLWNIDEKWLLSKPTYGEVLEKLRDRRQLPEQIDFQMFKSEQVKLFRDLMSTHNDFFYLPDGRYLRVIVIPHALGGLLISYEDITDKLTLEKDFKILSAVQKETIDHLNEGVSVFNENGRLQISNQKFADLWKLDKQYLKSKPHITNILEKIQITTSSKNVIVKFIDIINRRQNTNFRIYKENGVTLDILFVPLPDGATLISYQDITDSILVEKTLIEKNEALQKVDNLKTEFLANVSYELKSPLTSIIGFAQALDKQYFGILNEVQAEYISGINTSSQYLLTLINDILDLASIDAGYMQLEFSKFNIQNTIESITELLEQRVKERKVILSVSYRGDVGEMFGDHKRIKQVLIKLLSNAIEISKPEQQVLLIIEKEKNNIMFIVEDNNINISEEEQKYLFDKFHKTDIRKVKSKSAALGLALAKSFIELHGGTLHFIHKNPKGGIFECSVPQNAKAFSLSHAE